MLAQRRTWTSIYWTLALASLVAALAMLIRYTPNEERQGAIQRIFYIHMPLAINTFLGCLTVFIASIGYLWQRRAWWDDLASSAARVAVLLASGVLITGMFWAHSAWGVWWTWSPRLTFSLMLWLLYVVYVMIRNSIESPQRRALVSAVYGLSAFLDVPLVWLSARLIPDPIHPATVTMGPEIRNTLLVWFVPITLMTAGLIVARFGLNCRIRERECTAALEVPAPAGVSMSGGIV